MVDPRHWEAFGIAEEVACDGLIKVLPSLRLGRGTWDLEVWCRRQAAWEDLGVIVAFSYACSCPGSQAARAARSASEVRGTDRSRERCMAGFKGHRMAPPGHSEGRT